MTLLYPEKAAPSSFLKKRIDMRNVATVILAGGIGKRLAPLTLARCKPALPFAGQYRLIDIPISAALNAGCRKIYVATQFLSSSLHRHIIKAYPGVELLSVEQKHDQTSWYKGTADAVRQNIDYLINCSADYILILSGDQLYQMDLQAMAEEAQQTNANLLIAAQPISSSSAERMGIIKINSEKQILSFFEKPRAPELFPHYAIPEAILEDLPERQEKPFLGSMGIYLFKKSALLELLQENNGDDFGQHLIPKQIKKGNTGVYIHPDYWEDVGTVEAYYHANIALTEESPVFDLYSQEYPLIPSLIGQPPPLVKSAEISNSLICNGSRICSATIRRSIIGANCKIGEGAIIDGSYLFGNSGIAGENIETTVGDDCFIQKTIIDRNVKIGNRVRLINRHGLEFYASDTIDIRNGIIIVKKNATIPDYYTL